MSDDWGADSGTSIPDGQTYPEKPDNPHEAPLSLNFSPGKAPQVTIRGRTVAEWRSLIEEVIASGVFTTIGSAFEMLNAQGVLGREVGPASPAPAAAAPQSAGLPALPPGWYKLNVPFKDKPIFDGIVEQNGLRKADPQYGGKVSFQRSTKSWYCAPEAARLFAQFGPVPA